MKVFIQNEAGSALKHRHNEKTLELLGSTKVSRPYPFPYGFVIDTSAADGLNVDCFVLTYRALKTGEIVECDPIGLMEQVENDREDHNVLAVLPGEQFSATDTLKRQLTEFVIHVFDHLPNNKMFVGNFLDRTAALTYLDAHTDRG